eukprot:scaffold3928_cov79-Skeletonema_menzelii.AAC.3
MASVPVLAGDQQSAGKATMAARYAAAERDQITGTHVGDIGIGICPVRSSSLTRIRARTAPRVREFSHLRTRTAN